MKTLQEALRQGWKLVDPCYCPGRALVERRRSDGLRELAVCLN